MVLILTEHRVQSEDARQVDQVCLGGAFQGTLTAVLQVEEDLLVVAIAFIWFWYPSFACGVVVVIEEMKQKRKEKKKKMLVLAMMAAAEVGVVKGA